MALGKGEYCPSHLGGKGKKEVTVPDFPALPSVIPEQHHRLLVTWNGRVPDLSRTELIIAGRNWFSFPLWPAISIWLLWEALIFLALEVPVPALGGICPHQWQLSLPHPLCWVAVCKQSCSVCSFTGLLSWAFPHLYGPMFQGLLLPLIIYLLHLAAYLADSALSVLVYLVSSNAPHIFWRQFY